MSDSVLTKVLCPYCYAEICNLKINRSSTFIGKEDVFVPIELEVINSIQGTNKITSSCPKCRSYIDKVLVSNDFIFSAYNTFRKECLQ